MAVDFTAVVKPSGAGSVALRVDDPGEPFGVTLNWTPTAAAGYQKLTGVLTYGWNTVLGRPETYEFDDETFPSGTGSFFINRREAGYPAVVTITFLKKTYTLTYRPGDEGSGSVQTQTKTHDVALTLKGAIFTRAGYTQTGWATSDGGPKTYGLGATYTVNSDATLYPFWTGNELICTYNPNGGFATRYFDRVRIGETFPALPTATFGSETTNRWYTAATGGTEIHQGDTVTQTSDFMLYAHWSVPINTHTLTFDANGGTVSPVSRTLAEGAAFGTLPTPTRSGYTFIEWRTAPYVGTLVTSSTTMGTDDVTIYAIWTGNPLTITLNANGGSVSPTTKSVPNGSTYGILPRPTRSGFIFDGWWTAATGGTKILVTAKPSGSQTVYAHWHAQVPEGGSADWIV